MEWQSPRKIEEDRKQYLRKRFEYFMSLVDDGTLSEEEAIDTLRSEIEECQNNA